MNYLLRKMWASRVIKAPIENVPINLRQIYQYGLYNASARQLVDVRGALVSADRLNESIEFCLPWKFMLQKKPNKRDAYDIMADFSVWLIDYLVEQNLNIIPVVNFKSWDCLPPKRTWRRVSWHSKGSDDGHLHLKVGVYPEYVVMDERGFGGWSNFSNKDIAKFKEESSNYLFKHLVEKIVKSKQSKYEQPKTSIAGLGCNYIFFPMQMPNDLVSKLAYIDTVKLLKFLAIYAREYNSSVVVKRHPKCKSWHVGKLINSLEGTPHLYFVDGNVHDLIADSRVVVTVNSGVGAEALLHRKPVIVTGRSDYMAAAYLVSTKEELFSALNKINYSPKVNVEDFLFYYCSRYMIELYDDDSLKKHPALQRFLTR